MKLAAVLGDPIAHSLSPALHGHWLRQIGVEGGYVALRAGAENGAQIIRALALTDMVGVNVTAPLKAIAFEVADVHSPAVEHLGVANLLLFTDGCICADNTDTQALTALLPLEEIADRRVLIIGAGDTARMAALTLSAHRPERITIANRTPRRALIFSGQCGADVIPLEDGLAQMRLADIVINTLSPWPADMKLPLFAPDAVLVDYGYQPRVTPLARRAHALGARVISGLDLLVAQARPSFEAFYGVSAPEGHPFALNLREELV